MSIRKTLTFTALAITVAFTGTSAIAQANTRGDVGGYSQEAPGGGGGGGFDGASDMAGGNGDDGRTHGVIHDSDAQLDVWVTLCNAAGGGMSTEGGNYVCRDADGNEIDY